MKILFQGDSITDAFRKPDEINPAYQLGNGYAFLVAARLGLSFPGRFEFVNRAISGQTIQELAGRWKADALDIEPGLLSLLIGVNNIIRSQAGVVGPAAGANIESYRGLLERTLTTNPQVRLLILEPFLLKAGAVTAQWQDTLGPLQEGIARITAEVGGIFVPLQSRFDQALATAPAEYWCYDGIHPSSAGFQLIADAWLDALGPKISFDRAGEQS